VWAGSMRLITAGLVGNSVTATLEAAAETLASEFSAERVLAAGRELATRELFVIRARAALRVAVFSAERFRSDGFEARCDFTLVTVSLDGLLVLTTVVAQANRSSVLQALAAVAASVVTSHIPRPKTAPLRMLRPSITSRSLFAPPP